MGNQIIPSPSGKLNAPEISSSNLGSSSFIGTTDNRQIDSTTDGGELRAASISGDGQSSNDNPTNKYVPKMFDVWALGVNVVLGGQFYGWNAGMAAGFGSYAIGQVLVGFAYINLAFSLAEICSTISFSGGAYGMTRVVLGFYLGFIVAIFEIMEYITYISAAALFIASLLCDELGWDVSYTPLICLVFYLVMVPLMLEGNHVFWRLNYLVAIALVAFMLWYIFGSIQYTNFERYAELNGDDNGNDERGDLRFWFSGGMVAFMQAVPLMTWGFGGIESLALVTNIVDNPRANVPYGISSAVVTLFVLMMSVMFVASALPPGLTDFANMDYYMDSGFNLMGLSSSAAHWLILPGQFAMAGGFFIPASKLYHAISESHLLPPFLQVHHIKTNQVQDGNSVSSGITVRETATNQHHHLAIIYVSIISYVVCLIGYYCALSEVIGTIPILLSLFTYLSDLYAYYQLKTTFQGRDADQSFANPFGIYGAIYAALIFVLCGIATFAFQDSYLIEIIFMVVFVLLLSVYYFLYAKHTQRFSEEEQKKLLLFHVVTNNKRKRAAKNNKNAGGRGGGGGGNASRASFSAANSSKKNVLGVVSLSASARVVDESLRNVTSPSDPPIEEMAFVGMCPQFNTFSNLDPNLPPSDINSDIALV